MGVRVEKLSKRFEFRCDGPYPFLGVQPEDKDVILIFEGKEWPE